MKVIAVDDEQIALDALERVLRDFSEITERKAFCDPVRALAWLRENEADIAFLDINMERMDGLSLAKRVKEVRPACFVVFVTGYSEYALHAIRMHAAGYLLKPVSREAVREELDYILKSGPGAGEETKIRVQCFGNFEVFSDGNPMKFQYNRTKELLAYLVDRKGAYCTNGEIMGVLWEEQADRIRRYSYFRDLRSDLFRAFRDAGCPDALLRQRGMIAVVPGKIGCDYYDWIKGDIDAVNRYTGEYMAQYSWGELTVGSMREPK